MHKINKKRSWSLTVILFTTVQHGKAHIVLSHMSQNVQPRPGQKRQSDHFTVIQQQKKGQKWVKASVCIYRDPDTYSVPQKRKTNGFKRIFHSKKKRHPNVVSNPYNYISSNEIQKLQVFMLLLCIQLKFKLQKNAIFQLAQ